MNDNAKKICLEKFVIFIVMFVTYIFPIGMISETSNVSKYIFLCSIILVYLLSIKKFSLKEISFIFIILFYVLLFRDFKFIVFITLAFLDKLIKLEENIKDYILNSNILYICFIFTIFYSILYSGYQGRYAFSAIKEINQSGLAIFCLAALLYKKNKRISIVTFALGLLTFSRSYFLALFLFIISKSKFIKKIVSDKLVKKTSYFRLTILSSLALILMGIFFVYQYKLGNIYYTDSLKNKFFNLLDLSNFFRFTAITNLLLTYTRYPLLLFTGMTTEQYVLYNAESAISQGLVYRGIVPHNLFFSHLRMYGIFSVIETLYISFVLKKVVNKNNYVVYISIFLYSIILGAGMYSYWLYLTIFLLIIYKGDEKR